MIPLFKSEPYSICPIPPERIASHNSTNIPNSSNKMETAQISLQSILQSLLQSRLQSC